MRVGNERHTWIGSRKGQAFPFKKNASRCVKKKITKRPNFITSQKLSRANFGKYFDGRPHWNTRSHKEGAGLLQPPLWIFPTSPIGASHQKSLWFLGVHTNAQKKVMALSCDGHNCIVTQSEFFSMVDASETTWRVRIAIGGGTCITDDPKQQHHEKLDLNMGIPCWNTVSYNLKKKYHREIPHVAKRGVRGHYIWIFSLGSKLLQGRGSEMVAVCSR